MGVYVKGMKMPKNCDKCPCSNDLGCAAKNIVMPSKQMSEKRPLWCPLVEVSEPHGRLIDADALVPDICHDWNGWRVPPDDYSEECIRNAPTVIEAEDE